MSLFRFAIYFAVLTACAVAAFPQWAPADADVEAASVAASSAAAPVFFTHRKAARLRVTPARVAARD